MRTMHQTTWIVVADGRRARLLDYRGPNQPLEPLPDGEMETEAPPTREIGTDQPGRTKDRMTPFRHPMEPRVDFHEQAEMRFLDQVAERLNLAVDRSEVDRLVLVAPPKALGELRRALDPETRKRVIGEIDKDLTHFAPRDLPPFLAEVINI